MLMLNHRWASFEMYGSVISDKIWLKKDMRQIVCSKCTKCWEKLLWSFDRLDLSLSKLTFWWHLEISPSDSRILELPQDVENVFIWGESHKYFKYPKVGFCISFNHIRLSQWKGRGTLRGEIIWHISDGCFMMSWITLCTCFSLPLLVLKRPQSDQLRLGCPIFTCLCLHTPSE